MKRIYIFMAVLFLVACNEKKNEPNVKCDEACQQQYKDMYKTPPKSDRSKDKGF